jgi:DNA adenine methylase
MAECLNIHSPAMSARVRRTPQIPQKVGALPFLRWAGSKRQLIETLSAFWNESFNRYVEPFMGSACLFFALRPKRALLGDINKELVNTFRVVRRSPALLARRLNKLPKGKRAYYRLRNQDPETLSQEAAAARFVFLNRFCFNGLFRTNAKGHFNVPYAASRTGALPDVVELERASQALKAGRLCTGDFETILERVQPGDFIYLDPPFAVANRRVFKQYGPNTFGFDDLQRLAKVLRRLEEREIAFVLSYAYCREALDLFARWPKKKVFVRRNIAGFTKCRRMAAELLVSNLM